jgi:hypothetical protein
MDDDSINQHYQSTLRLYRQACTLRDDAERMASDPDVATAPEHQSALHNYQHARWMALIVISKCRAGNLVEAQELYAHAVEVFLRADNQLIASHGQKFIGSPKRQQNQLTLELKIGLKLTPNASNNELIAWLDTRDGFTVDYVNEEVQWWHRGNKKYTLFITIKNRLSELRKNN